MLNKYKLKEGVPVADYVIPGVGTMRNGEIETPINLESPILVKISGDNAENPAAGHVLGVAPQASQPIVNQSEQTQAEPTAESTN